MKYIFSTLFLLTLITFRAATGLCHNSCSSCDLNICKACTVAYSKIDPLKRACVCNENYYAESLNPLKCTLLISGNEEDVCEKDITLNMGDLLVQSLCYYDNQNIGTNGQLDFVVSDITIDSAHSQLSNNCRNRISTEIQYRPKNNNDPKEDNQYIKLTKYAQYVSNLPGGKSGDKRIRIPLIEVYDVAFTTIITSDQSQIYQEIRFRILIGFIRNGSLKTIRAHKWTMFVYTNRRQVQVFSIEVDIQRTESCQDGQECIIIADLDVTGNQYKPNWNHLRPNNVYIVGDWMYMKVWFKDATYSKQLSFQKLYFKNDANAIFDHTSLTDASQTKWSYTDNSLHVKLKLIEPSVGAVVQVNMLIETSDAHLRSLQNQGSFIKQQFKAEILSSPSQKITVFDQNNDNQSSLMMLFGLINLLALVLFY